MNNNQTHKEEKMIENPRWQKGMAKKTGKDFSSPHQSSAEERCDGTCEASQETGGCPCATCHGNHFIRHPLAHLNREWTNCPTCRPSPQKDVAEGESWEVEFLKEFNHRFAEIAHQADRGYDKGYGHGLARLQIDITKFIDETLSTERRRVVEDLEKLKETWTPTEGYGSEEELGFQKGIIAQIKLKNRQIDDLLSKLK